MNILETINQDFVLAMKEKREAELSTLRLLRAALKNKQIELMHELKEEDILAMIRTQIKQLKDALLSFETANRSDLVEKTKNELLVLEKYLPAEISDEELNKIVQEILTTNGVVAKTEAGKAMGAVMKTVAGRANGARVKETVERLLK
ncbi:MAG: GatB/YqeY domain-containing protein [Candidatus Uhrbacteria bacterium]